MEQGTLGDTMYVIAMGIVRVSVDDRVVKKLTVGDHFGEMSIVTHEPRCLLLPAALLLLLGS